jgi:hypothetical protein
MENGKGKSNSFTWGGTSLCEWETCDRVFYEVKGCGECDLAVAEFMCFGEI